MRTLRIVLGSLIGLTFFFVAFEWAFGADGSKYVEVSGASNAAEVERECDAILDRLQKRYGRIEIKERFPVVFGWTSPGVAGYCQSGSDGVSEVRIGQDFNTARGGTLDHELTHAYICYRIRSGSNLFWNEGTAQNSEYKRRSYLRETVYERFKNGDFGSVEDISNRGGYDSNLVLYHQSFSVVDFLIAKGGSRWFLSFFEDAETTNDYESALKKYYGFDSCDALEKEWRRYVRTGQNRKTASTVWEEALR